MGKIGALAMGAACAFAGAIAPSVFREMAISHNLDGLVRASGYTEPVPRYGCRRCSPDGTDVAFYGLHGEPLYIRYMREEREGSRHGGVYDCAGRLIELSRDYVLRSLERTRADQSTGGSYLETFCARS